MSDAQGVGWRTAFGDVDLLWAVSSWTRLLGGV